MAFFQRADNSMELMPFVLIFVVHLKSSQRRQHAGTLSLYLRQRVFLELNAWPTALAQFET